MADCIFCKIVDRAIPSDIVYEDADVIAFSDVNPAAPLHVLFIPRLHIATMNDMDDAALMAKLMFAARDFAAAKGVAASGYRLIINCNPEGGQTVYHLHVHLLAGRQLRALG